MTTLTMPLDCDGFAAVLADYLEGDATEATRAAVESHAASCLGCGQLLADLGTIRHDAASLPPLVPSHDLWAGIAERIDARVLPLEGARTFRAMPARMRWMRSSIAAAALVLVTAGITHYVTVRSLVPATGSPVSRVAVVTPPAVVRAEPMVAAPIDVPSSPSAARHEPARAIAARPERRVASVGASRPAAATRRGTVAGGEREPTFERSAPAGVKLAGTASLDPDPVYGSEITKLRRIVRERRAQLDPATVAVLEQSIAVIDSAIAQSRSALAKDPASGFLASQLNHSLEKKVELLRTAALLPART
ncbi:MAG: hypothetical protein H0W68_10610 [Gemmatimonadaceae bacterium]|nr:hypothetical protein [Gemmatimonadaceae bacterium]